MLEYSFTLSNSVSPLVLGKPFAGKNFAFILGVKQQDPDRSFISDSRELMKSIYCLSWTIFIRSSEINGKSRISSISVSKNDL